MKSILITGATSGLGKCLAIQLSDRYNVYCLGRDKLALAKLEKVGLKTLSIDFLEDDWIDKVDEFCPNPDILINNAGIFPIKNFKSSDITDYDSCFKVNVRAPFILMKNYIPRMISKNYGKVINILSSSAYNGSPDTPIYCASKHALLGMTRSLFLEYRDTNVSVTSISPGSMQTPMGATDKRQDYNTFIDTKEVVNFIAHILELNQTMVIDEVRLNRKIIRWVYFH